MNTSAYQVVWDSPSRDSSGSMPLGNGEMGINVWVEEDGDLLFYISRTDAWSENARLLKLGRVRLRFTPSPFRRGLPFRQTLEVRRGEIEIRAGGPGEDLRFCIWVDANRPVIRVEAEGSREFCVEARLEVWRATERVLEGKELFSAYGLDGGPDPVVVYPDTVLGGQSRRIVWFHRNERSCWGPILAHQGLGGLLRQLSDPLQDRTFGGAIQGEGLVSQGPDRLASARPARRWQLSIHTLTAQTSTAEGWLRRLDHQIENVESGDPDVARRAHRQWWEGFWARSWIHIHGPEEAERVNRGYVLQRFLNACAGRGAYPIKFNGSLFTVDSKETGEVLDADYRRWGGPYWFQNTRLPYWSMLASGDFDLLTPLFRMYLDALPLCEARTCLYFGHEGAFFPETMYFWGAYANSNYGWQRAGKPISQVDNTYIRYYWTGALELTAILLDAFAYTQDEELARSTLLPLAESILRFYDQHFPRDAGDKLLLKPGQALETWQEAVNALPDLAGLRFVLDGLLALPRRWTSAEQRQAWERLRGELPPLPMGTEGGLRHLLPAETFSELKNSENPELYAVYPFRLYGVGKPDLAVGRLTYEKRRVKRTGGWAQDAIQAAHLGLAEEARSFVVQNFSTSHPGSRFPAFWGPNFDWIPDQDHGSVAVVALQAMLLQAEGRAIRLFPAWPESWDVEFKLHAPMRTTVEGRRAGGRLEALKVTP
ncbi:MAG: hypothetical protein HYU36_24000 [Planctomycetes bacterium]|nr:hypothetical protein [Planctomycetota bacterium]